MTDESVIVETRKTEVEETKEMAEVYDCLEVVVAESKKAGKDGFQALTDIPSVMFAALQKLPAALTDICKVIDEARQKTPEFIMANGVGAAKIAGAIIR